LNQLFSNPRARKEKGGKEKRNGKKEGPRDPYRGKKGRRKGFFSPLARRGLIHCQGLKFASKRGGKRRKW